MSARAPDACVLSTHDDILEIVLDNPPVNALSGAVRQSIDRALAAAQSDSKITAIVIRGGGKLFSGGADITEFGKPWVEPGLPELVDRIEASAKPVIAAVHGTCFGGGMEVALGCHYRIAAPSASFGLPEVKLGILPGAGGTQRLPRLIGAQAALGMIVSGDPVTASDAQALGLLERVVAEDRLAAEAILLARQVAQQPIPRTGARSATATADLFERFVVDNARKIRGLDAPAACVEAIKAATQLPLADGLAVERALFTKLMHGAQFKALRHIFFAERAASKIDGLQKDIVARSIARIGVIGAGTMGGGITMNFLSVGLPVTLVEMSQEALDRGVATIRKNYEATAAKGRMTAEQVGKAMGLLEPTLDFGALAACDLVIEAVYESMDVKRSVFAKLDAVAKPGAILASNTSYLNLDEIAASTARPQDVIGLHFFSPANVMRLMEVVRGEKTAPDVLATAMQLAKRIRKIAVVARVCYGFIGNRMLIPRQQQALALLLEGATPSQVDRVHTAFGMPMGPFQMADLAGVDIGWHRDVERVESIKDALCAQGRWGQKTKAGFYDYDEKRKASPSPVTTAIIDRFRAAAGITPRAIDDDEIIVRTLYTMVNEAAKILEEGIAQRASDIDTVWVFGYGWPSVTGGPMFWADTVGPAALVAGLDRYRSFLGANFSVATSLRAAAKESAAPAV